MAQERVSQFRTIFKKFLGVFVLMILFAIAELAPETNAEEANPLAGKWAGHSSGSVIEHVLRVEEDHSFTWDSNGKLLMSGTWSDEKNSLDLKFGNDESDVLHYDLQLHENQLQLTNDSANYSFSKASQ